MQPFVPPSCRPSSQPTQQPSTSRPTGSGEPTLAPVKAFSLSPSTYVTLAPTRSTATPTPRPSRLGDTNPPSSRPSASSAVSVAFSLQLRASYDGKACAQLELRDRDNLVAAVLQTAGLGADQAVYRGACLVTYNTHSH